MEEEMVLDEYMEIATVSPESIRVKGKSAAFVINPVQIRSKTSADAVLMLSKNGNPDLGKVEEYRLVITGAGDYEVAGAKISALGASSQLCYFLTIDNSEMCVTSSSFLAALGKDFNRECSILALYCDDAIDATLITEISPRALVLFGAKAGEVVKSLGKESSKTSKIQLTSDKLPEEMQVTVLN